MGLAGAAFQGRPWVENDDEFYTPGADKASWGFWGWNGKAYHGCVLTQYRKSTHTVSIYGRRHVGGLLHETPPLLILRCVHSAGTTSPIAASEDSSGLGPFLESLWTRTRGSFSCLSVPVRGLTGSRANGRQPSRKVFSRVQPLVDGCSQ